MSRRSVQLAQTTPGSLRTARGPEAAANAQSAPGSGSAGVDRLVPSCCHCRRRAELSRGDEGIDQAARRRVVDMPKLSIVTTEYLQARLPPGRRET